MFNRVLAAVCAALLGASVLIAPAQSAARGGAVGGFRAGGGFRAAGGFHRAFVRPRPFVRTHAGLKRFFPARAAFARHHRRFWYGGVPYAAGVVAPLYGS